jgi:hypothetical protein
MSKDEALSGQQYTAVRSGIKSLSLATQREAYVIHIVISFSHACAQQQVQETSVPYFTN